MNVNILHDRALVRKIEHDEKSSGGIVFADMSAKHTNEAIVLAVGEGRVTDKGVTIPMTVKVGDRVMYKPDAGTMVNIKGENLLVLKEEEIFAVNEQ